MANTKLFKLLFGNVSAARFLLVTIAFVTWCVTPSSVFGDSCKPDVSGRDSITKKQVDMWRQVLSSSGFLSAALMDNDVTFTAFVQRGGDKNYIMIVFQKVEDNLARAAFESHYHATKGDQIIFGFKNGEPVTLVASGASNRAQAEMLTGKLDMSAEWVVELPDNEMATLRDALTTRQVDAIRIALGSGQVDRTVPEKNGTRLMEKFGCFYQALDKRGVVLSAASTPQSQPVQSTSVSDKGGPAFIAPPQDYAISAQGTYVRKDSVNDSFDFGPDGLCHGHHEAQTIDCTYTVQGDAVMVTSSQLRAPVTGHFSGNTLTFAKNVYEKQAVPQKPSVQLTIDQVIAMVVAKLPDDIVISTIQNSGSKFDLSPEALIKLKKTGVSDAVIRAMAR